LLIAWEKEDWEDRIAKFAKSSSQALLLDDVWKILHLLQQVHPDSHRQPRKCGNLFSASNCARKL
jgi:hypothetical protein